MNEKCRRIVEILIDRGQLHSRSEKLIEDEFRLHGAASVIPKLLECRVRSDVVAIAVAGIIHKACYPWSQPLSSVDDYFEPRKEGDESTIAVVIPKPLPPETESVGQGWLIGVNRVAYVVNVFDRALIEKLTDDYAAVISEWGVISAADLAAARQAAEEKNIEQSTSATAGSIDKMAENDVNDIIRLAAKSNASDIHFEPHESDTLLRMRVDGDLRDIKRFDHDTYRRYANSILVRCAKGQPGTYIAALDDMFVFELPGGRKIKLRVAMVPTVVQGQQEVFPKLTIRLLGNVIEQISLVDLGIPNTQRNGQLRKIRLLCERKNGLILVSGPTGSGKTTTLSAVQGEMLKLYRNRAYYTVEDPNEISIPGVNHVQVNIEAGLTFARAIKSFLRSDPDVIMVGEIRDKEVADQALTASVTGHLVLSTIHTNSAPECILRLVDMGCDRHIVASALKAATAQRLAKKVCPHCSQEVKWGSLVDGSHPMMQERESELQRLRYSSAPERYSDLVDYPSDDDMVRVANKRGCRECTNGYKGRMLISELLEISPRLTDMIAGHQSMTAIRTMARKEGFMELWEHGFTAIRTGKSTFDEMLAALGERDMMLLDN